jgi:hypothetical protein
MSDLDAYLDAVARKANGPRADRLAAELRDHVADALADGQEEALVLERLGPAEETVAAWQAYARRSRRRTRARVAVVTLLAACASALAVVQLAAGHRADQEPCTEQAAPAACEQPAGR